MKPSLRSSGVLMAYIKVRKIVVDMRAYSISCVALNAISMMEIKRKVLLLKRDFKFFGIVMALPEKRP